MSDEGRAGSGEVAPAEQEVTAEILDRLEALPDDSRREMMAVLYQHTGPLPDPGQFAAYKAVDPEAPRAILAMAKRDHEHRIDMASRMLTSEISYRRETLLAALVAFLAVVAGATVAAVTNHEIAAGSIAAMGGVAFAVGAWLKGRDLFPKSEPPSAPEPAPAPQPPAPVRARSNRPPQRPPRR